MLVVRTTMKAHIASGEHAQIPHEHPSSKLLRSIIYRSLQQFKQSCEAVSTLFIRRNVWRLILFIDVGEIDEFPLYACYEVTAAAGYAEPFFHPREFSADGP